MNDRVLVDTSAWVKFLRKGRSGQQVADEVEVLIRSDRVCYTEPVYLELLIGARAGGGAKELEKLFSLFPLVQIDDKAWIRSMETAVLLGKKGFRVDLPDLLISSAAILNGLQLFHNDNHFRTIAGIESLNEYSFLNER